MSTALQRQNESLRARLARARSEASAMSVSVMADGAGLIAAYAFGKAEANDSLPPAPWELDPSVFYGGIAKAAGALALDGEAAQLADSLGQSLLTVYAYRQGRGT